MTWVRIDDGMAEHPKLLGLSDRAFRIHVRGLCYAARHLTDGFIPAAAAAEWGRKPVGDLVAADLWDRVDGGYLIHDFLDYNPSREQVETDRDAARDRMAKVRAKRTRSSGDVRANTDRTSEEVRLPRPLPLPEPQQPLAYGQGNPAGSIEITDDQRFLRTRLVEKHGEDVSEAAVVMLNGLFGAPVVSDAMRDLHGFPPSERIRDLMAYLRSTCQIVAEQREAAGA